MNIDSVAVIGAGSLGRRLAMIVSGAGFYTVLEDILPSNLRKAAAFLGLGADDESAAPNGLRNLRFATTVEEAVRHADLIIDCVPDELESKLEIFSMLDRMAPPQAVLVTPTRGLSIADLASCTYRPERCLAVEFPSPNLLLGEILGIVSTTQTSREVLMSVVEFWLELGFAVESKMDPAEASVAAGTLF